MAHVLVIDDEAPIRLLCRVNLEAAGMKVSEGSAALAATRSSTRSTGKARARGTAASKRGARGSSRPDVDDIPVEGSALASQAVHEVVIDR